MTPSYDHIISDTVGEDIRRKEKKLVFFSFIEGTSYDIYELESKMDIFGVREDFLRSLLIFFLTSRH